MCMSVSVYCIFGFQIVHIEKVVGMQRKMFMLRSVKIDGQLVLLACTQNIRSLVVCIFPLRKDSNSAFDHFKSLLTAC